MAHKYAYTILEYYPEEGVNGQLHALYTFIDDESAAVRYADEWAHTIAGINGRVDICDKNGYMAIRPDGMITYIYVISSMIHG